MNYQFLPSEGGENVNTSGPSLSISKDTEVSFKESYKMSNDFVLHYAEDLDLSF